MSKEQQGLRSKLAVTHLQVALLGIATFLVMSATLAFILPSPNPADLAFHMLLVLAVGAIVGGVVSAFAAVSFSNRLFTRIEEPLRRMMKLAQGIAKGNYSERITSLPRAGAPAQHGQMSDGKGAPGASDYGSDVTGPLATALNDLAASLEAAEQRRTLSFGELAHEIRTPVAVLEGYLEGLLDGHVKPSDKTWAMLYDEAGRVHRLVDELQALSRAEARQSPLELQAVDPAAVAQGALDRLHLHFQEKGLQVTTAIEPRLPMVLADPDQALQALVNLLTNALRYTSAPGQVNVSVGRLGDTNEVVFKVTDTGVGIAAEHIPHLFERFFRIDRAGSRSVGGSGIGLPVAKALVEAMGGRIWAESPGPGKGSTFSFTLLASGTPHTT